MSAVTAATVFAGLGAAASVVGAFTSKPKEQQQAAVAPPAPEKPPEAQTPKAPSVNVVRRANAGAEGGGANSPNNTTLTGPSGVSNDLLSLGKNTLLGA